MEEIKINGKIPNDVQGKDGGTEIEVSWKKRYDW